MNTWLTHYHFRRAQGPQPFDGSCNTSQTGLKQEIDLIRQEWMSNRQRAA